MIDDLIALDDAGSLAREAAHGVANELMAELTRVFDAHVAPSSAGLSKEQRENILSSAQKQAVIDLRGLLGKDPATLRSPEYVLRSYTSFRAVLLHRLAHQLLLASLKETAAHRLAEIFANPILPLPSPDPTNFLTIAARQISEMAKVQTRVDIHPAARIGCPFILDHGAGTVIGETACIGKDCYFLQDVVLGAANIRDNPPHDRHPKVGDDVIMAGGIRAFGRIRIGSGARIQGLAVITHDIPPNAHVQVQTFLQIVDPKDSIRDPTMPVLYAVLPGLDGVLTLFGENLESANVTLVNQNLKSVNSLSEHLEVQLRSPCEIRVRIRSPLEIIGSTPPIAGDLKSIDAAPVNAIERVWGVCLTEDLASRPGRVFFTMPGLHRHLIR
jgi:serine O-acetyltransferase